MRNGRVVRVAMTTALLAILALGAHGQATGIKLFTPVNNSGGDGASATNPVTFATKILNLSCPASPTAVVSSTADGSGKILVDNYITLTVTQGEGPIASDICALDPNADSSTSGPPNGQTSCFLPAYEGFGGGALGQNPDTYAGTYGIGPLNISSMLGQGSVQLQFDLVDWGSPFASTTLYLYTDCTGTPISSGSPTVTSNFNTNNNQQVTEVVNFTGITIPDGTNLIPSAAGVAPGDWPQYVAGSPFATTRCIPHTGQDGKCTLYTDVCTVGNSSPAGVNCPQSTGSQPDIMIQDVFDANPKPNTPLGTGFGFLMGGDNWSTQGQASCTFEGDTLGGVSCPQNILTSFTGDGSVGSGSTKSLNSTLATVSNVLMPNTFPGASPSNSNGWTNASAPPTLSFRSYPPGTSDGQGSGIGIPLDDQNRPFNGYVAAPIHSIAYNFNGAATPPAAILNSQSCFVLSTQPVQLAAPAVFTPSTPALLNQGQNTLEYSATDCAGISELLFSFDPLNNFWSTSKKTAKIYFDSMSPTVSCGGVDTVWHNANVTVNCSASDNASGFLPVASTDTTAINGPTIIGTLSQNILLSTNYSGPVEIANAVTGSSSVTDLAGNGPVSVGPVTGFKIDTKAPVIAAVSPSMNSVQNYLFNQTASASYKCSDGGAGVKQCGTASYGTPVATTPNVVSSVNTAVLGQGLHFNVSARDASTPVGNASNANLFTYNVSYLFIGFLKLQAPPFTNPFQTGKPTAILFGVQDGKIRPVNGLKLASAGGTVTLAETVYSTSTCSGSGSAVTPTGFTLTGGPLVVNRIQVPGGYSLNWTPPTSLAGKCVTLGVNLGDGVPHKANLKF